MPDSWRCENELTVSCVSIDGVSMRGVMNLSGAFLGSADKTRHDATLRGHLRSTPRDPRGDSRAHTLCPGTTRTSSASSRSADEWERCDGGDDGGRRADAELKTNKHSTQRCGQ